jgi:hypothetical protein
MVRRRIPEFRYPEKQGFKISKILLKIDFTMPVRYRPTKYNGDETLPPSPPKVIHLSEFT